MCAVEEFPVFSKMAEPRCRTTCVSPRRFFTPVMTFLRSIPWVSADQCFTKEVRSCNGV
jgi:hypothetical protein